MSETQTYTTIELNTGTGPVFRRVSTAPPRKPTEDEIPVIDLSGIYGTEAERKAIASKIRTAAQNTGFFYVRNHGIEDAVIQRALGKFKELLAQPQKVKGKAASSGSGLWVGYRGLRSTQINRSEMSDNKEQFSMRYDPRNDNTHSDVADLLETDSCKYMDQDAIWAATAHLPEFREALIEFWQRRLHLARKMIRLFALALDLPEDHFDAITTRPGADSVMIHYPGTPVSQLGSNAKVDVGIGSHTDIQCITLLWQDNLGGLQVLSAADEWLDAYPSEGTFVVNIGDFLQRLSNNRFKSTVHRVYNCTSHSRYSMAFFLGFNPDAKCEVLETCVDEEHPPLYEPISCGEWHRQRLQLATAV